MRHKGTVSLLFLLLLLKIIVSIVLLLLPLLLLFSTTQLTFLSLHSYHYHLIYPRHK